MKNEGDSGRMLIMPWGSSDSLTLLNNQSLAANSPTRITYWNAGLRDIAAKKTKATHRNRFLSNLMLV